MCQIVITDCASWFLVRNVAWLIQTARHFAAKGCSASLHTYSLAARIQIGVTSIVLWPSRAVLFTKVSQ